ncbi:hypothetical protein AB6A40_006482 [Gnathostoma spinigerum]|uniref:C2H2-type domain-containing protein n=1 Tax=Gnathostoma spinigerum TaxID=75299 RepID=A0ABD6EIQ5_9BILA
MMNMQPTSSKVMAGMHSNISNVLSWVYRSTDSLGGNEQIRFRCLWNDCLGTFPALADLSSHIQCHISFLVQDCTERSMRDLVCLVDGCDLKLVLDAFPRHMQMHLFHASRQQFGLRALMDRADFANISSCGFLMSSHIKYEGGLLDCRWNDCGIIFEDIMSYTEHISKHIDLLGVEDRIRNNSFSCLWQGCEQQFRNKSNLRAHVRHHSGDKVAACPFCGTFFVNNTKMFDHMLRKLTHYSRGGLGANEFLPESSQRSVLTCILCQKIFESQRLLREHCRRHVMYYKCEFCTVTVDSPSALYRHILIVHAKEKPNKCEHCGKFFARISDLARHRAVHSNEPQHICEKCGERFRWRKQLLFHERRHSPNYQPHTHLCHLCDAKYVNGYGLTRHLMKKHGCLIPEGFSRFQYKKCADGFFRLQTKRCLSKRLAKQLGIDSDGISTYPTS